MPQLRVLLGYQQGQVFSLESGVFSIGRDPETNVMLHPESAGSRRHAEIFTHNGAWRLRDLGSVNGTKLNGLRIAEAALADKDEVVIGDNVFVFEDEDGVVSAIAEAASRALPAESRGVMHRPAVREMVEKLSTSIAAIGREWGEEDAENGGVAGDVLAALISRGHVVFAGAGDGGIVRPLAGMFDLKYERVNFTSAVAERDLFGIEGGDVAGRCVQGPIFTQMFFAEDFNRASNGTQMALCGAMEEYSVVAEGMRVALEPLFFVMATQGGIGEEGTRALSPERLDRFMFSIAARSMSVPPEGALKKILNAREIMDLQKTVGDLPMSDHLVKYAIRIVRATRPADSCAPEFIRKYVSSGTGPRGAHALVLGAKARAIIAGRSLVTAEDIRGAARCALSHRVFGNAAALREGANGEAIVRRLVAGIGEP